MPDPVVHITNGVPDSGTGNITTLGQTLLDGANATHGATTDAAVTAGAAGTLSAKLRSISRDLVANIVLAAGANIIGAVTQSGAWVLSAGAAIIGKVGIDQTTDLTTNKVRAFIHDGTTALPILAGSSGAPGPTVPAIPVSIRDVNANITAIAGGTVAAGTAGAPVVGADQYGAYKPAAASATTLMGVTGAVGDYLAGVLIIPGTAAAGTVGVTDGNGSTISLFAGGGTTALPSLVPFFVPLGIFATAVTTPGWRLILGANVTAVGVGKFT